MAKKNKKSLIIWATVALVIGVILGLVITGTVITGQAKRITENTSILDDAELIIVNQELYNYAIKNNITFDVTSTGDSTDCESTKSTGTSYNICKCISTSLEISESCNCVHNCPVYIGGNLAGYIICKRTSTVKNPNAPTIN